MIGIIVVGILYAHYFSHCMYVATYFRDEFIKVTKFYLETSSKTDVHIHWDIHT